MEKEQKGPDDRTKKWSSEKLQEVIKEDITKLFESVLDYAELVVSDKSKYDVFRSKILRLGNNTIRKLSAEIEKNYDIVYKQVGLDILKVRQPVKKEG